MGFLQGDVVVGQRLMALNWQRAALDLVLGKNPLLWEGWGAGISCPEKLEVFKVGWGLEHPGVMESVPQSLRTHIPCSWNQAELSCRREMNKKPDIYISWCLFRQLYQSITEWNTTADKYHQFTELKTGGRKAGAGVLWGYFHITITYIKCFKRHHFQPFPLQTPREWNVETKMTGLRTKHSVENRHGRCTASTGNGSAS